MSKESKESIIDRYIYDVIRRLPKERKDEVSLEIRQFIEGKLREEPEQTLESVLLTLGPPAEFAKKYKSQERSLIGPEYIDTYLMVLKIAGIVLLCIWGVTTLVSGFDQAGSLHWFVSLFWDAGSLVGSALAAFAVITFVFAVLEYKQVKLRNPAQDPWTPSDLPPLPTDKAVIKRSDSIVGIVFTVVFMALIAG
ncbi:MAG: hypothetical protein ACK5MN_05530 [Lachnospiraceae bacterium]